MCNEYLCATDEGRRELGSNFREYQRLKDLAQKEKDGSKKEALEDGTVLQASFDLPSVLQIQSSDVSSMYYKRKICVYNLTAYCQDADAYCFMWRLKGKEAAMRLVNVC